MTLNYYADKQEWHKLFNEFAAGLSIHQQTPFFWHLMDNKVTNISQPILQHELDQFLEEQKKAAKILESD